MSNRWLWLSILAFLVTACAGSQAQLRLMETSGDLRVDASDDPDYDYKVSIKNGVDIGWDGDDAQDRALLVHALFAGSCQPSVVGETSIPVGQYGHGAPARFWVMKVKCRQQVH